MRNDFVSLAFRNAKRFSVKIFLYNYKFITLCLRMEIVYNFLLKIAIFYYTYRRDLNVKTKKKLVIFVLRSSMMICHRYLSGSVAAYIKYNNLIYLYTICHYNNVSWLYRRNRPQTPNLQTPAVTVGKHVHNTKCRQ